MSPATSPAVAARRDALKPRRQRPMRPRVAKLLAAGARFAGKTHTAELAFSLDGRNEHYGTPENPAAPGRVPGGLVVWFGIGGRRRRRRFRARQRHRRFGARPGIVLRPDRIAPDAWPHRHWRAPCRSRRPSTPSAGSRGPATCTSVSAPFCSATMRRARRSARVVAGDDAFAQLESEAEWEALAPGIERVAETLTNCGSLTIRPGRTGGMGARLPHDPGLSGVAGSRRLDRAAEAQAEPRRRRPLCAGERRHRA